MYVQLTMVPWQWNTKYTISNRTETIPRIIWTYWNNSEHTIPDMIGKCINTWRKHNPTYDIHIVTPETLSHWLPGIDIHSLRFSTTPQRISDFVRLYLLLHHGGFWIDASVIMFQSLEWFRNHQQQTDGVEVVGYYMGAFTTNPKFPVVESWFIGAIKNSVLIRSWTEEFMRINDYVSSFTYIEHMKWCGVSMQNIGFFAYYLAIHAAIQSVMQRRPELTKLLSVRKAEDGPFKYLEDTNWNVEASVLNLTKYDESAYDNVPFIKLRKTERRVLEPILECVKFL